MTHADYKAQKITQVANYLLYLRDEETSAKRLALTIWAADRFHIRHYGRPLTKTVYFVSDFGPVSQLAHDLLFKTDNLTPENEKHWDENTIRNTDGTYVTGNRDTHQLSKVDIHTLENIHALFEDKSTDELESIAKTYPEYTYAINESSRKIYFEDFFKNPHQDEFFTVEKEQFEAAKEYFNEMSMLSHATGINFVLA